MKHLFGVLIVLIALSSCNPKSKILTEKEFSQKYLTSLKSKHPGIDFKITGDLTIISFFNGNESKHFLDNAYREYKLQPDSMDAIISRYVESSSLIYSEKQGIQINRIVPIIKPVDYLDDLRQLSKQDGEEKEPWIVYEKYNDQLIIVYAEDTDNSLSYFSKEEFDKLGINRDTLLEMSIANMKTLLPETQRMGDNGTYGIAVGGNFEASLILLKSLWTKENFDVKGDFIIAIPNRDILLITGSDDAQGMAKIKATTEQSYKEGNYSISPYLYKWDGNRFEKYK